MVNIVETALILVLVWSLVLSVDFLQLKDVGPHGFQKSARRIFHSYWPSLIIYETLLIVSYGLYSHYWFTTTPAYLAPAYFMLYGYVELPLGFVGGVVLVWGIVRDRTDEMAAIKREITNGLRVADSLEQYLEPILERISANLELERSKHTLRVLRGMGSVYDSRGAAIGKSLEKRRQ